MTDESTNTNVNVVQLEANEKQFEPTSKRSVRQEWPTTGTRIFMGPRPDAARWDKDQLECPHCRRLIFANSVFEPTGFIPSPGAHTLCFECFHIVVFDLTDSRITIRKPRPADRDAWDREKEIARRLKKEMRQRTL